jgi:hypothetical protein
LTFFQNNYSGSLLGIDYREYKNYKEGFWKEAIAPILEKDEGGWE